MQQTSTTRPVPTDRDGGSRDRPTHLRWVFPSPRLTAFDRTRVVGRDEGCDTVLEDNHVSRRHAELRVDGPIVAVRDLSSRNGVFVNGERRPDARLDRGDVVRCGDWIGVVVTEAAEEGGFREIVPGWWGGAALLRAVEPARRLRTDLPVIVQGETGTGKEGVARALHDWSGRRGPFLAVNCATLTSELAESELFGYRKGAFTGAHTASQGLFRAAHGGTLFLDEILELPLALQPKLLRVLEDGNVRAVGDTRDVPVDVRVLAAAQAPLEMAVDQGRFRADLHARLHGLTVVLPRLRHRREDILPLFQELLRQHARREPPALEAKMVETLCLHDWPTNVRGLRRVAERLFGLHGQEPTLTKAHLLDALQAPSPEEKATSGERPAARTGGGARRSTQDQVQFEALAAALRQLRSVARAAAAIGVSRARAYRLLRAHPDFSLEDRRK